MNMIDLTNAADPRGTCPSCRSGRLTYDVCDYPGTGARPISLPSVCCDTCGYTRRIAADQRVLGARGARTWEL